MKKILIVPLNTDLNRGDQALVWESIRVIRDVYSEEVEFFLIETGNSSKEIERQSRQTRKLGYTFLDPILKHPGRYFVRESETNVENRLSRLLKWGCIASIDFIISLLLLVRWNLINDFARKFYSFRANETIHVLKNIDAVYVKGGGFLHAYGAITDFYQMYYSLFLVNLAIRYRKPIYFLPNSIGPLHGFFTRKLVAYALKNALFISVREHISKEYLHKDLRINCKYFADLGYHLENKSSVVISNYLPEEEIQGRKVVGITLRPWRFPESKSPRVMINNYIQTFTKFVDYLELNSYYVCLFVHTLGPSAHENDEIAVDKVYNELKNRNGCTIITDPDLSCYDMMRLYSRCDYFIGTRFHSVIFAQNQSVPTIAISYGGNKGNGIMEDLGLLQFVIRITELSYEKILVAFNEMKKQAMIYKAILSEHNENMLTNRSLLITELKQYI